jgi:hypothetical protein
MSTLKLDVGTTVHFARAVGSDAASRAAAPVYRVEHLMKLPDGATFYTIRCEAEPFERVVAASDLDPHGRAKG